jgi:5'-nucleotidase
VTPGTSAAAAGDIVLRLVSINDVYNLSNLPKLATFLSTLGPNAAAAATAPPHANSSPLDRSIRPSAVCICGDFVSPSTLSSMDGGKGHVQTLRAAGITHASLGNHEADVTLPVLRRRISELGKSALLLNGNVIGWLDDMDGTFNAAASFGQRSTAEWDAVGSDDGRVRVGLTGLLSDETNMFRTPHKFRGLPIESVTKRYDQIRSRLMVSTDANVLVPMTHQSLSRDFELAQHMLKRGLKGVILGGHEHERIYERINADDGSDNFVDIVKTGQDAERCSVVDFVFDDISKELREVHVNFEELAGSAYEDDREVLRIANKHLLRLNEMENSVVVDVGSQLSSYFTTEGKEDKTIVTPLLSSERARFQQTTVGALFCQAIKTELETDACIINGAPIKACKSYPNGTMSHGQLKEELPFPLKMVVVAMTRGRLRESIQYSRTQIEEGKDTTVGNDQQPERRGYLQTDFDWQDIGDKGRDDEKILVALPRNLMAGFCKIRPLMDLGEELKVAGIYPEKDDYLRAIDLVIRFCCKGRWAALMELDLSFDELDLNNDGKLDKNEIKIIMTMLLGKEPDDVLLDNIIAIADSDGDGHISREELDEIYGTLR